MKTMASTILHKTKSIATACFLAFLFFASNAQTNFNAAEYFFDTDPGIGSATAISIPLTADSVSVNPLAIPTTGLSEGSHTLFIRTRTDGIKWSIYEGRTFWIKPQIVYAEYFIDTDPGAGLGTMLDFTDQTDSISFAGSITIPILSGGFHNLFIRTRDSRGIWSLYEGKPFYVNSSATFEAAEWFIDTDPGIGNGTAISISGIDSASASVGITVPPLSGGWHNLFIRTKVQGGTWSLYEGQPFYVNSGSTFNYAEYFLDTDPGVGNATAISFSPSVDSLTVSAGVTLPVNIIPGNHNLFVRARTQDGKWSHYEGKQIFVKNSIVAAEYFYDKDPGIGNGTPLTVSASPDSVTVNATGLSLACLDSGTHYLFIRTKDAAGNWSLYEHDTLFINQPAPQISAVGPTTICAGDSVVMNTNTGTGCSYQWYLNNVAIPSATSHTYTANVGGTYKLVMTTNAVAYTSNEISITLGGGGPAPSISASGPTTFCDGGSVDLTALPNSSLAFLWSTGATTQTITVNASGNYFCTVTDNAGCDAPANITVTVNANPTVSITPASVTICNGASATLTAGGGASYLWSNGANTAATSVSPASATTYSATVTDVNSCTATASRLVNVNPTPNVSASNTGPYCLGGIIQLNATGASSFTWSGPNGFNSSAQNPTRAATTLNAGNYTVTGTDANSCTASFITNVVVNGSAASITPSSATTFCAGGSVDLTASAGSSWSWSNGATTQSITVDASGNYSVTVTDANSCTSSATQSVTVNGLPTTTANHTTPVCENGSVTLQATGGTTYTWSGPSFTSSLQNPVISSLNAGTHNGTYTVTVTNAAGCSATANTSLTVNANPSTTAGSNSPVCQWTNILFTSSGGTSYAWSGPNSYSSSLQNPSLLATVANAGNYNVTVTNASGCSATASTNVVVNTASAFITPNGPTTFCAPGSVTLSANAGTAYSWSTGATTQDITVTSSGTFSVSVTAANGCSSVASGYGVTVSPPPTVNAGNTGPYCVGYNIQLNASGTNISTYSWSGVNSFTSSAQNPTITNSAALNFGAYNVTATSSAGCTATATTTVSSNGNAPVLSYSGNAGFTSHIVDPLLASPYTSFRFEVKYTDADGNLPAANYPRVIMDYEGNGNFTDANDRLFIMQQADPTDVNVVDGKIYFYVATGLPVGLNYQTRIVANDNSPSSCTTTFGPFAEPDVLDDADIFIFANDITFSETNPDTSAPLQVCATIHNESDYPALNFVVKLKNQYDTLVNYGNITVPYLAAHSTTTVCWNITTPNTPSWNPMQVFIDYTNVINEPNELDNQAIRPFVCGNFILPGDIKLTAQVNPQTSYAVSNNWLNVSGRATYRNTAVPLQDPSCAGATVSLFVPATGATYSTYTNSQGYYSLSFLAPVTPGVYNVQVSVTDFTLDGDTTAPYALNTPPCAADLSPYSTLPVSTIVAGQSIVGGQFTVSNNGCANVNVNTLTTWTCSGATTPSGSAATSVPFNTGTTQTFNLPVLTFNTAGNYTLCVNADANNNVSETSEANQYCRGITVLPACADVTAGVNFLQGSYQQCQPANFSFSVSNAGGLPHGSTSFARLVIKRAGVIEAVYSNVIPNLSAQTGTSFSYTHNFANTGAYDLIFSVDTTNIISECNEGNNVVVTSTTSNACVYKPDLMVQGCSSFNITPVDPLTSPTIGVTAVIQNSGNATANGPFTVSFNVAGNIYNHNFTGNLAAGASSPITINAPTPASPGGNLVVTADVNNDVTGEWNETNNSTTVSACHDYWLGNDCLYTLGNDFWEKNQILNQPFNMVVWLRSGGLFKAGSVKTKFEISGPGLAPGWNDLGFATNTNVANYCSCPIAVQLPTPFACPATGTYQVRMTADYDAQYAECDEGNNVFIVSFNCNNLPDYRTLSQYTAPSLLNPEPNQPINISISYDNIGASNIGDSMEIKLLVDDIAVDSIRDKTLANGDHWTTMMPNTWSSPVVGVHILRAVIDANNEILESNEGGNNQATRAIIVGQSPNLRFAQITPSDSTPNVGDVITFTVTIANDGDQDAESDIIFKYVDDNGDTVQIYALNNGNYPNNASTTFTFNWTVADASTFIFGYILNTTPGEYLYDDNVDYTQLGALQISFTSSQESCIDANNGTLTAHVSGGTPPYSFIWNNGGADSTITDGAGNYSVTVVDFEGNTGSGGGSITTVSDVTYPIIGNMPANITYNATNGICPATISWSAPVASDNCGLDTFYSTKQPGSTFNAGTTTVTYTAKDKAGNMTAASFTVTVVGLPLVYAGADATICGSGTLNATAAQWGTGAWSVATGTASFGNSSSEVSSVNNLTGGINRLVWSISNGSCGVGRDTVVITQPTEICGNSIDDDCDGTADDGCAPTTPVWNGSVNNDWSNPLNWTPNFVPSGCAVDVIIPDLPIDPVINAPVSIGDVTISANAHLTVNSTLNVCGDWLGGAGANALVDGNGELILSGFTPQQVGGRTRISRFVLKNPSGASLQAGAVLEVFDVLELENGDLNTTAGTLRLLSTSPSHVANINDFGSNSGTLTGNVTAQRFVGGAGNLQHQVGLPVSANLSQIGAAGSSGYVIPLPTCDETATAGTSPYGNVFRWDESNPTTCILQGWNVMNGSTPASAGRGYNTYLNGGSTLNVTGAPNLNTTYTQSGTNGGYLLPTLQSSGQYSFDGGWNLYSNPFPSGYTYTPQAGFDANGYVYVPTGAYSGTYQLLTPGTVIAPFQGIMLHVSTPGTTPVYTFSKANRVLSGSTVFYQNNNEESLRLEVSGNGFADVSYLNFNANATNQFDTDFDLRKQRSNLGQPTIFTDHNSYPMGLNAKTSISDNPTVPLALIPGTNGTYTITVNGIQSFDPTSYIYLEDKVTGTYQNVRDNISYTFTMTKNEDVNRFVLHFTPKAEITSTDANCNANGQIVIEQPGTAEWQYAVENSNAVAVGSGSLHATSPITLSVPAGIYTVTLTDYNGYQVVKQVQVNGTAGIVATGSSSIQQAEVNEDITFTITTANATIIEWNFGDGNTASTATATHSYAQEGVYTVTLTVTNADGCSSTLSQTITVNNKTAVGLNNITNSNIRMWSSGNKVLIDFSKQKNVEAEIAIYDILGRELSKEPYNKSALYSKEVLNTEAAYIIVKVMNVGELMTRKLFISNR
jgi:hypothetical protein